MARAAALALCLLALAIGAQALCTHAGKYMKLDLATSDANGALEDDVLAKCLTSFKATIVEDDALDCALQITPLNSGGSYIPGLWATDPGLAYKHFLECPTEAGFVHTLGSVDSIGIKTIFELAMEAFPYGMEADGTTVTKPIAITNIEWYQQGGVKIERTGAVTGLWYAVTEITLNDAVDTLLVNDAGNGPLNAGAEEPMTIVDPNLSPSGAVAGEWTAIAGAAGQVVANDDVHVSCNDLMVAAGITNPILYGVVMGEAPNQYKMCLPCPAGTNSTGFGCTTCPAGYASAIFGEGCRQCPPGTFSTAGSSDCIPCPTGTFSGSPGASECTECPEDSYAWIPGSPYCMRCDKGTPVACDTDGVCPPGASSPGTMIFSVGGDLEGLAGGPGACALTDALVGTGGINVPEWTLQAYEKCTTWAGQPGDQTQIQWAFRIAGDCSIQISPITDPTCADPTCNEENPADCPLPQYGAIELRAYYAPPTFSQRPGDTPATVGDIANVLADPDNNWFRYRIMSLFDTFQDSVTPPSGPARTVSNSLMINIQPDGTSSDIFVSFFAATAEPFNANQADNSNIADYVSVDDGVPAVTQDAVCRNTWTLRGGEIFKNAAAPYSAPDACPYGSYYNPNEFCPVCPVGHTCPGGTPAAADMIPCEPNFFNPILGLGTSCTECAPGDPDISFTSYEGAQSCTVPRLDLECKSFADSGEPNGVRVGYQFDLAAQACVKCPPGSWRDYSDPATTECKLCDKGEYSDEGATLCLKCPIGQYNPLEGLPNQESITGINCIACAEGSVALGYVPSTLDPQTTAITFVDLVEGAWFCEACPAGTNKPVDPIGGPYTACEPCPTDTYRSGDATPENNECRPIPAGYRLKEPVSGSANPEDDVLPASEIDLCPKGTVSFYDPIGGWTRIPINDPTKCAPCNILDDQIGNDPTLVPPKPYQWKNTYAPRKGMTQCIACPGGTIPFTGPLDDVTYGTYDGTYRCDACPTGQFRDAYTVSDICEDCPEGNEVGPNNKMACTACRPGYYADADTQQATTPANLRGPEANFCQPCPVNEYRPTFGALSCMKCPRGTGTANSGNVECTACPIGYYNNAAGTPCSPAPAGTFVNTTGAFVTAPCPKGTWNNEMGQDNCNPCAPGKYSNTLGSKECKTCPAGTYSAGQASSCLGCRAGYAAPAGAAACSPCKPGTYAPDEKSATCKLCPKGFQCPTNAMKLEGPCPRGTFSNKEGNRLCTPCPVNTYSMGGGIATAPKAVMACIKCQPGTSTRGLTGQSKCQVLRPQVRRLLF